MTTVPADKTLYVVHCVDTEGPLHESLDATFERLEAIIGRSLPATRGTLEALRRGEIDVGGREELVRLVVSERLLNYNDTWDKVDAMLEDMMSPAFRGRYADPDGNPWVINWFCVDHVGYDVNPRRRDIGYHNVFDHYRRLLREHDVPDEIHWHVHPMPTYREAHRNATSYLRSPHVLETLARRAIDRAWFPVAFRPGFHVERPDSHWLLEQFVPFDFGNQAMPASELEEAQDDLANGRFGDWRRAPDDWSPYHPSHDDYQVPGGCRRTLFRCLNVGTRLRLLDEAEVRRAFARADRGEPTVLAFTNHDFRDMRPDVADVHALVERVAVDYPEVAWRNAGALQAARAATERGRVLGGGQAREEPAAARTATGRIAAAAGAVAAGGAGSAGSAGSAGAAVAHGAGAEAGEPLRIDVRVHASGGALHLEAVANRPIFGPQPLLAVKTHSQQYLVDNLDIQEPFLRWSYVFDEQSFRPASLEAIALAAADARGNTAVTRLRGDGTPLP